MTGNPPATLRDVKGYMEFWGWTNGGGPSAIKFDESNNIIAHYGDAIWIKDVEEACAVIGRLADKARRPTTPHGGPTGVRGKKE
jgi:hypothetical protein